MRLINTDPDRMVLKHFLGTEIPPYAILSHCWGSAEDEVTFQQFQAGQNRDSPGHQKIVECCRIARSQGLEWAWVDTCCIDKTSSAELSESINSMFTWYERAVVCYAFLESLDIRIEHATTIDAIPTISVVPADLHLETRRGAAYNSGPSRSAYASVDVVEPSIGPSFERSQSLDSAIPMRRLSSDGSASNHPLLRTREILSSGNLTAEALAVEGSTRHVRSSPLPATRWFERGWTLQELLAPKQLLFFDSLLTYLGTRSDFATSISQIVGIDVEYLNGKTSLEHACIAQKMSWAAPRQTTRPEDIAYCLLGLFEIQLPLLYGEGEKNAFRRLQEAVIAQSEDDSIFAWKSASPETRGLLAERPSEFALSRRVRRKSHLEQTLPFRVTNLGIELSCFINHPLTIAVLSSLLLSALSPSRNTVAGITRTGMITKFFKDVWTMEALRIEQTLLALACVELPLSGSPEATPQQILLHLRTPRPLVMKHYHRWYRTDTTVWNADLFASRLYMNSQRQRLDILRVTIFVSASNGDPRTSLHLPSNGITVHLRQFLGGGGLNIIVTQACILYWHRALRSSPVLPGVYLIIPALMVLEVHLGTDPSVCIVAVALMVFLALLADSRVES
jgi:hypothetical protein